MFNTHYNKQNFGRIVPRMGIYSLNKLCKCNFHRTQYAISTRRKLKIGSNSLKAGDILALALRKQAGYLGLCGPGQLHVYRMHCICYCNKQGSNSINRFLSDEYFGYCSYLLFCQMMNEWKWIHPENREKYLSVKSMTEITNLNLPAGEIDLQR